MTALANHDIAARLREAADLLEAQQANPHRVRAYRTGARTVEALDHPAADLLAEGGREALTALPGIGDSLAGAIAEMVRRGRWSLLDRLRGAVDPESLFQGIPGVGPDLAHAIHGHLGAETLEALEAAAHDGRLEDVPGVGARRAAMIRASLGEMLRRSGAPSHADSARPPPPEPPVALLLAVDRDYRAAAEAGTLPTIAPRRFNPDGRAWLPILHDTREGWHFTALYSNTARAHELGRVHDWVVLYFHHDGRAEAQRTVVTEHRGPLAGYRVVRGREGDCRAFHAQGEGGG